MSSHGTAPVAGGADARARTAARQITQEHIDAFAALSGDHHPQHIDADWSATSLFGQRVAHGMLVLSAATGLVPIDPERVVALRHVGATFKRPVLPGDEICVEVRPTASRRLDDHHQLITSQWRILNQDDKLVALAAVEVLWRNPGEDQR